MRTSEDRTRELHRRMDRMKKDRCRRQFRVRAAAVFAVCFAIAAAAALMAAGLRIRVPSGVTGAAAASIFAGHAMLGRVVTALLAFGLGVLATIFCFRMKKHMEETEKDDRDL